MKKPFFLLAMLCFNTFANKPFEFVNNKTNTSSGALNKTFIQKMVDIFNVDIFFETGTFTAGTTINAALYFKEIHTVELHNGLFNNAKRKLAKYTHVHVYHGSSPAIIKSVAPICEGTILFWLDAHYSGQGTALSFDDHEAQNAVTAIRGELEAIKDINIKDCIILIDDIRGFGTKIAEKEYMGCWAYPSVQKVQVALLKINPHFEIVLLGDMLLAYDKYKYQPQFSDTVKACTKTRLYDGYNLSDKELLELEHTIMHAPTNEKEYIKTLYNMTTNHTDPMFWHDFWYGLVQLGSNNYTEAHKAFSKVKVRQEHLDNNRQPSSKIITYDHWRIDRYLELCITKQKLY